MSNYSRRRRRQGGRSRPLVLLIGSGINGPGGIARYCRELSDVLEKSHECCVVDVGTGGRHRYAALMRILRILAIRRPNLVILGHINFAPIGILARVLQIKFVIMVYGMDVWTARSRVKALASRVASEVWAISSFTRQAALTMFPNATRMRIVGAAVGDRWFAVERRPTDRFRVLTVARMDSIHGKGIDVCLDAIGRLSDDIDVEYIVLGGGGEELELRRLAALQPGRVTVLGALSDTALAEQYATASVILLMSPFASGAKPLGEGLGLVVLEGAAAGVPAIVSRAAGVPETVVEGVTGFIVEPGDAVSLASCLADLSRDRDSVELLGLNARRWCWENFRTDVYAEKIRCSVVVA